MIEFDESEYLSSTVEDSELIAVLSFYAHLPIMEAIAEKDKLLYEGRSAYGLVQLDERDHHNAS